MRKRLPPWLKVTLGRGENFSHVRKALAEQGLHTVCSSARCPNLGECWNSGTATFMILGDVCTRNCRFCAVPYGVPKPLDSREAGNVVKAVKELGLKYAVITSVTRDDLNDGGSNLFSLVIRKLKEELKTIRVEVLIPDFKGNSEALNTVLNADPDVLNHNVETVPSLYSKVRPQADYMTSLKVLNEASQRIGVDRTKSGMMLGFGESREEIINVFNDLLESGVGRLTLGQYLQPTREHLIVHRYLPPAEFDEIGEIARKMGFKYVASGPLVRSSYHAAEMDETNID